MVILFGHTEANEVESCVVGYHKHDTVFWYYHIVAVLNKHSFVRDKYVHAGTDPRHGVFMNF